MPRRARARRQSAQGLRRPGPAADGRRLRCGLLELPRRRRLQESDRDRALAYQAALVDKGPGQSPYICSASSGTAGFGSRCRQLAASFGDHGFVEPICSDTDLRAELTSLAGKVAAALAKM